MVANTKQIQHSSVESVYFSTNGFRPTVGLSDINIGNSMSWRNYRITVSAAAAVVSSSLVLVA